MDLDLCGDDSFYVTWDFEFGGITVVDETVSKRIGEVKAGHEV